MNSLREEIENSITAFGVVKSNIDGKREVLNNLFGDDDSENDIYKLIQLEHGLHQILQLLDLREKSWDLLKALQETPDDQLDFVMHENIQIPLEYARIFRLQSYLTCLWSIYDRIAGYGKSFLYKNKGLENAYLQKNFIKNNMKDQPLSLELLHNTLTKGYGLHIELSYAIRNIFIHTSGLELDEFFVSRTRGDDCFQLAEISVASIQEKMTEYVQKVFQEHSLLVKRNLIEILQECEHSVDSACVIILRTSTKMFETFIDVI